MTQQWPLGVLLAVGDSPLRKLQRSSWQGCKGMCGPGGEGGEGRGGGGGGGGSDCMGGSKNK
jgi:hypothetical protein